VSLDMSFNSHLYTITRLAPAKDYTLTPLIYLEVQAVDEIGAFGEAQIILNRLGYTGAAA